MLWAYSLEAEGIPEMRESISGKTPNRIMEEVTEVITWARTRKRPGLSASVTIAKWRKRVLKSHRAANARWKDVFM